MRFKIVLAIAKLAWFAIRLIDKNRGTDFPGRIALKLYPDFAKQIPGINYDKVIVVTGSNGKTTTTNLLYHVLKVNGKQVASNLKGSNMLNGVLSVYIKDTKLNGAPRSEYYIWEVDERSLPTIYNNLPFTRCIVTNVMQDQVHRNGEPDLIYSIFSGVFNKSMKLYLNNHEPRSKSFEELAGEVVYFGASQTSESYFKDGLLDVSMPCPICRHKIDFSFLNLNNVGDFKCSNCSFSSSVDSVQTERANFEEKEFYINDTRFPMPYDAPVMLYNYSAASAVCLDLGLCLQAVSSGLSTFVNASGRMEEINYKGKKIKYIRMKQENPETLQGALDAIASDPSPKLFVIGLCTLDERRPKFTPHYANTYYAYDCDFKRLLASNVEKSICFSEFVCYDIANRLYYDGAKKDDVVVVNSDSASRILEEIDKYESETVYFITLMKLMEGIKKHLAKTGGAN
ncbi:MAG: MurT ligase domain-containing protein [Eubacteriaceae bacterium]|nr:MurT ligase domain-containing protein [Eubacteriaceae bacterium]